MSWSTPNFALPRMRIHRLVEAPDMGIKVAKCVFERDLPAKKVLA